MTVRLNGAVVPIGSLLIVIALMVSADVPTGVDDEVRRNMIELPSRNGLAGRKLAVTPAGRPVTLNVTRVSSSLGFSVNVISVDARPPSVTVAALLLRFIVYSSVEAATAAAAGAARTRASATGATLPILRNMGCPSVVRRPC